MCKNRIDSSSLHQLTFLFLQSVPKCSFLISFFITICLGNELAPAIIEGPTTSPIGCHKRVYTYRVTREFLRCPRSWENLFNENSQQNRTRKDWPARTQSRWMPAGDVATRKRSPTGSFRTRSRTIQFAFIRGALRSASLSGIAIQTLESKPNDTNTWNRSHAPAKSAQPSTHHVNLLKLFKRATPSSDWSKMWRRTIRCPRKTKTLSRFLTSFLPSWVIDEETKLCFREKTFLIKWNNPALNPFLKWKTWAFPSTQISPATFDFDFSKHSRRTSGRAFKMSREV